MVRFSQEFKLQAVEKALSKRPDQTLKNIVDDLGVGYSTLQTWIRLARKNKLEKPEVPMSKEKSPQDWNKAQRLEAIMHCHRGKSQSRYGRPGFVPLLSGAISRAYGVNSTECPERAPADR